MPRGMRDSPRSSIEPVSPALAGDSLPLSHQGSPTLGIFICTLLISVGASSNVFLKGLLLDFRNVKIVIQPSCSKEW